MLNKLNHRFTPLFLQKLNTELESCLTAEKEDFSDEKLKQLIALRHRIVIRELKRTSASDSAPFAANELEVNKYIDDLIQNYRLDVKTDIVDFYKIGRAHV